MKLPALTLNQKLAIVAWCWARWLCSAFHTVAPSSRSTRASWR